MNVIQKLFDDMNFEKNAVSDLKRKFDVEAAKSVNKRDLDSICALADEIFELTGGEIYSDISGKEKLFQRINESEKKILVTSSYQMHMDII